MLIEQICNTITNLFNKLRPPFPQLNRLLLVCSMIKRPGLSPIYSTANVTKDLNKMGIPTGSMPDGSPNLTVAFVYTLINEVYRAMKKDASVQVGTQPGSMQIQGQGANAGGPVTIFGMNLSCGKSFGTIE